MLIGYIATYVKICHSFNDDLTTRTNVKEMLPVLANHRREILNTLRGIRKLGFELPISDRREFLSDVKIIRVAIRTAKTRLL